jgi:hypothetical protein
MKEKKASASLRILTAIVQDTELTASRAFNRISRYFVGLEYNSFEVHFTKMRTEDVKKTEEQRTNAFARALQNEEAVIEHLADCGFSIVPTATYSALFAEVEALRLTVAEYSGKVSPKTCRKAV